MFITLVLIFLQLINFLYRIVSFSYQFLKVTVSCNKEGRKEENVLFNNALKDFILQLYGIGHMVKDHSDSKMKPTAATTWATLFE